MSKHSVVWLDHKEARIFNLHPDVHEAHLHAPSHQHHKHPTGAEGAKDHPDDAKRFFHEIARSLEPSEEILVVGPAKAKLELIRYLHKHAHALGTKVELDAATRTPLMWGFGCDESEQEMKYFSSFQGTVRRLNEARQPHVPEVTDPFATWLRSESIPIDKVERSADGVRATPSSAPPLAGDRLALVKAFAERAARSEGLPALDTVDLQPRGNSPTSPALLPKTFGTLTLRQAKPPLDGPCIDPRVEVNVFDAVVGPPSVRIVGVAVECAKEPATGSKAPPDAGRPLPRAAAASLPFMAICDSINFAWGYQHSGRVIDKRGDVYTQVTNDGRSGSLDAVG